MTKAERAFFDADALQHQPSERGKCDRTGHRRVDDQRHAGNFTGDGNGNADLFGHGTHMAGIIAGVLLSIGLFLYRTSRPHSALVGRIPGTGIWNTPYPLFNVTRDNLITTKQGGARLDYQLSPQTRFMLKGDLWRNWNEGMTGGSGYPSAAATTRETGNVLNLQLTRVLSNRALNELKAGYAGYYYFNTCHTTWSNHWYRFDGPYGPVTECGPIVQFTGFTFGGNQGYPRHRGQDRYWVRDDLTLTYEARGRHDLRAGGEFIYHTEMSANCTACRGVFAARGRPAGLPTLRPRDVNELVRGAINRHIPSTLHVIGQIAEVSRPGSGHIYFSLKDDESELRCDLPNGARISLYGADDHDSLRGLYFDGVALDEKSSR